MAGALRLTQQYASVLGSGAGLVRQTQYYAAVLGSNPGNARVTQCYVSVLADVFSVPQEHEVEASSSVLLTDASLSGITQKSVSDTLILVQELIVAAPVSKQGSSPITVAQEATMVKFPAGHAVDTLELVSTARSNIFNVTADNTLTVTDELYQPVTYVLSVAHPITLVSTLAARPNRVFASDTLSLTSIGDNRIKARDAFDLITLDDLVHVDHVKNASSELDLQQLAIQGVVTITVTTSLELVSTARNKSIIERLPSDTLELDSTARASIQMLSAETVIELVDEMVAQVPWRVSAISELIEAELQYDIDLGLIEVVTGLQDSASTSHDQAHSAQTIISFATEAKEYVVLADVIAADAEDELELEDAARISLQESTESILSITQSASAQLGTPIVSELDSLDTTATVNVSYGSIAADGTISISHSVGYVLEKPDTLCNYSPFVGDGSPTIPSTYTDGEARDFVVLQYPATGEPTTQITLTAPNLDDRYRLGVTRIARETRGGTLEVFADPQWPKVKTLVMSFSSLSAAEGHALLDFMSDFAGQDVKLIDWEGKEWVGVIDTPEEVLVQDGPGCDYTGSFEMEVESV